MSSSDLLSSFLRLYNIDMVDYQEVQVSNSARIFRDALGLCTFIEEERRGPQAIFRTNNMAVMVINSGIIDFRVLGHSEKIHPRRRRRLLRCNVDGGSSTVQELLTIAIPFQSPDAEHLGLARRETPHSPAAHPHSSLESR
ncbi:hypothetical protein M758_7G001100 [Ceratodon purpureus]|uniref:Uncharacterized protein n=1 Tax=Ceratodon purpureus TaxID=3225 RepID=A0A8T0H128_CERPU|nr:hypothetical protein KC19_7G001000 [Ceratodon purpureus]KAG0609615.1 hypothetical protein M758_7G001100 [Ceratodon purpureus]